MARGDRVELRGFGAFSVKQRPARTGRNPRTGAHVSVDQKCVPFFKTGKEMRERLNRRREADNPIRPASGDPAGPKASPFDSRCRGNERSGIDGRRSNVLRKIVAAVILVPLAIIIVAFAVANRQIVTVSLDPFSPAARRPTVTLPLFALIFVLLILGVVIGGFAAWLRQGKWRRMRAGWNAKLRASRRDRLALRHRPRRAIVPDRRRPPSA